MEQYKFTKNEIEQLKQWIEALESGQYKQTTGCLQDDTGYCCLGVGCKLFIDEKDLENEAEGYISGAIPSDQKNAPNWLKIISADFTRKSEGKETLISLNDGFGLSFEEIAAKLRKAYAEELKQLENE